LGIKNKSLKVPEANVKASDTNAKNAGKTADEKSTQGKQRPDQGSKSKDSQLGQGKGKNSVVGQVGSDKGPVEMTEDDVLNNFETFLNSQKDQGSDSHFDAGYLQNLMSGFKNMLNQKGNLKSPVPGQGQDPVKQYWGNRPEESFEAKLTSKRNSEPRLEPVRAESEDDDSPSPGLKERAAKYQSTPEGVRGSEKKNSKGDSPKRPAQPDKGKPGQGERPAQPDKGKPGQGERPAQPDKGKPGQGERPAQPDKGKPGQGERPAQPDKGKPGKNKSPGTPVTTQGGGLKSSPTNPQSPAWQDGSDQKLNPTSRDSQPGDYDRSPSYQMDNSPGGVKFENRGLGSTLELEDLELVQCENLETSPNQSFDRNQNNNQNIYLHECSQDDSKVVNNYNNIQVSPGNLPDADENSDDDVGPKSPDGPGDSNRPSGKGLGLGSLGEILATRMVKPEPASYGRAHVKKKADLENYEKRVQKLDELKAQKLEEAKKDRQFKLNS
jgi:hypothetical protein